MVVSGMVCIPLAEIIDHASFNHFIVTENLHADLLLISTLGVKVSKVTKKCIRHGFRLKHRY